MEVPSLTSKVLKVLVEVIQSAKTCLQSLSAA